LKKKIRDSIGSKEIYKFLKDTIDNSQNILIVIDGPKPEFEEIMDTCTDTREEMVKVQIVNHFKRNSDHILTTEPPFQKLPFGDAVLPSPDKEVSDISRYTEKFHLQNRQPEIVEIYEQLKKAFIAAKATVRFGPAKNYTGVVDTKRIEQLVKKYEVA